MERENSRMIRATLRVRHAMGYFELGMMGHALACLDEAQKSGPLGAFTLVIEMLRAEILQGRPGSGDAAQALERLAAKLPPSLGQPLWSALSACYRQAGDVDRAIQSQGYARGAKPQGTKADD